MSELTDALGHVALFRGLSEAWLGRLAEVATPRSYAEGEVLFHEGDAGEELFVVIQGKVRISRDVAGMGEEALAVLGPGEAFGEMSVIDEVPRSADAIAHEDCRLMVISKDSLEDLLFLHKDLAYEILWNFVKTLSHRLRDTNDKMTMMSITARF